MKPAKSGEEILTSSLPASFRPPYPHLHTERIHLRPFNDEFITVVSLLAPRCRCSTDPSLLLLPPPLILPRMLCVFLGFFLSGVAVVDLFDLATVCNYSAKLASLAYLNAAKQNSVSWWQRWKWIWDGGTASLFRPINNASSKIIHIFIMSVGSASCFEPAFELSRNLRGKWIRIGPKLELFWNCSGTTLEPHSKLEEN